MDEMRQENPLIEIIERAEKALAGLYYEIDQMRAVNRGLEAKVKCLEKEIEQLKAT